MPVFVTLGTLARESTIYFGGSGLNETSWWCLQGPSRTVSRARIGTMYCLIDCILVVGVYNHPPVQGVPSQFHSEFLTCQKGATENLRTTI